MELEKSTLDRVTWRLVPFMAFCFFISYIDRANIGVAALAMNHDLGLSPQTFGLGAGIFFLGSFLFEVPSNIMLHRLGARRWFARIMFSWGVISGAMAFLQGETGFYVVRALLGIAEAGFFPGVIFFLTLWFPAAYLARVMGYFTVAAPLSIVIGSPVSAMLLGLDGVGGIAGWRWLFVLEALPAVVLAVVVLFYLTDRPENAKWLSDRQKSWLVEELARERQAKEAQRTPSLIQAMFKPAVLALGIVYFAIGANSYGLVFFLPQIVKEFGLSNTQTGFVSALPFLVATVGMIWWGRRSDRKSERRFHAIFSLTFAGVGMIAAGFLADPYLRMAAICVGALGTFASLPVFWTLPTAFMTGGAAAVGIAVINSIANLSGFVGPYVIGYFRELTGAYGSGLIAIGSTALLSALIVLLMWPRIVLAEPLPSSLEST